jgi:hypothetical protein
MNGDKGGVAIAKALETNTAINTLNLESNEIGDQVAAAMSKKLEGMTPDRKGLLVSRVPGSQTDMDPWM